jgi:hypothetical protein
MLRLDKGENDCKDYIIVIAHTIIFPLLFLYHKSFTVILVWQFILLILSIFATKTVKKKNHYWFHRDA